MGKEELLNRLAKTVIDGDEKAADELAQEIIVAGIDPLEAILHGATKGIDIVGERFHRFEAFLPELIMASDAMKACMAVLKPHIKAEQMGEASLGNVVIGTVSGDVHDVGKTLVATMLSVTGFDVYDLGVDVPVKRFIEKAEEVKAKVIALSALLTTSAYYQKETIRYLKDAGLRGRYYVVVGGGPITPQWAVQIGADGHGRLATDVPNLLKQLIAKGKTPPLPEPIITGY